MTCDTLQTADVAVYHFEKMFAVCKLWPGFFLTISQYAMASAFFNTKHPTNANAPLSMPVLTQEVSETFTPALIGGYSSVNSVFHNPSNAILDNTPTTTASFFDACRSVGCEFGVCTKYTVEKSQLTSTLSTPPHPIHAHTNTKRTPACTADA